MAHFIGVVEGNRGGVSRLGSQKSGVKASVSGWMFGVKVYLFLDTETGLDTAEIYLTDGSAQRGISRLLGRFNQLNIYGGTKE